MHFLVTALASDQRRWFLDKDHTMCERGRLTFNEPTVSDILTSLFDLSLRRARRLQGVWALLALVLVAGLLRFSPGIAQTAIDWRAQVAADSILEAIED